MKQLNTFQKLAKYYNQIWIKILYFLNFFLFNIFSYILIHKLLVFAFRLIFMIIILSNLSN